MLWCRFTYTIVYCQVSHARRVYGVNGEVPDSYVKCYLRDGDKWLHKRKTRVVRRTTEPNFKQTLKYQVRLVSLYFKIYFITKNTFLGSHEHYLQSI